MQTPRRPVPGTYFQTPANNSRYQTVPPPNIPPLFQRRTTPPRPRSSSSSRPQGQQSEREPEVVPIVRAANTINETLLKEASFPDLDSYVTQGISAEYDISENEAWAPYQKKAFYGIPLSIHELYNQNETLTQLGLFAELNHAWMICDNRLFLWDYTNPDPEIIGFEEESTTITSVKLMIPRKDVFVEGITHILVVANTTKILLLGVAAKRDAASGIMSISLYRTDLSLHTKGINVASIVGSAATGRIFFSGNDDNDICELTYQQEDRWFSSRCGKINHTSTTMSHVYPANLWTPKSTERVVDLVVDDSRYLVYALSSEGTIRTFHMNTPNSLVQVIEKTKKQLLNETSHMLSQPTPLFDERTAIISISAISGKEASKLHLMATTSSGCRLFLSATRGYGYIGGQNAAPQSMQLQHLRFPPREIQEPQQQSSRIQYPGLVPTALETQSRSLQVSRLALRFPPGFFLDFVTKDGNEAFFLSAPDSGRLAYRPQDSSSQMPKYYEQAIWMDLEGRAHDVGLVTKSFAATAEPKGFGNELAVQFDEPAPEFAILTDQGVHLIRRRRLLDLFSSAVRQGGNYDDPEEGIQHFIKRYGHGEAAAAALAVACGQTVDNGDVRVVKMADPVTMERARKAFVENGLKAIAQGGTDIDQVRPSSRHEGIALYTSRVVRSVWKSKVIKQKVDKDGRLSVSSEIPTSKLKIIQEDLTRLADFLEKNKNFIHGLEGPNELQRVSNPEEETALKGEHRALHSLRLLIKDMVEGISFVQMLFDERVDQIWLSLDDPTRQQLRDLTYEKLFSNEMGKALAKVLVKAIVTRNITNGSNIETVADALRRRCGSFCSTQDVITFKAQEQIKKATEKGRDTDLGRALLNDSLTLLKSIAEDLPFGTLESTVASYISLQFFAGAIELALHVAGFHDKGNKALHWVNDNSPPDDARATLYEFRIRCYALIKEVLENLDAVASVEPETVDGRAGTIVLKRREAYTVVNDSDDELFQTYLYDYYLEKRWIDRLLDVDSKFISSYLEKLAQTTVEYADLLWQFYSKSERFYEAGAFQLQLAKSDFEISLERRIEYLSFAKANAMTATNGIGRQTRQLLLHEVNNLLDVANIQAELLQRLLSDPRVSNREKRAEIIRELDGPVVELTVLFNTYADPANYFDVCLLIYQAADFHMPEMIRGTWEQLINDIHTRTVEKASNEQPFEAVINAIRDLSHKLTSETYFPPREIIPLVEKYAFNSQRNVGSAHWVPDLFIDVGIPYETIVPVLEDMFYSADIPFVGNNRLVLANHLVYVVNRWLNDCLRNNRPVFGSREGSEGVLGVLVVLEQNGLRGTELEVVREVRRRVTRFWGVGV